MVKKVVRASVLVATAALTFGCAKGPATASNQSQSATTESADAPIDQRCADDFAVLLSYNPVAFKSYRVQFDKVSKVYAFYKAEANRLGRDPKELLAMELESKLNQICSRVKYSVYVETQMRLSPVSSL